jgi:Xaa-Pro aminopeptidase
VIVSSPSDAVTAAVGPRAERLSALARRAGVPAVVVRDPATACWLGVDESTAGEIIIGEGEARLIPRREEVGGPSARDSQALERELSEIGFGPDERLGLVSASVGGWSHGRRWLDLTWWAWQVRAIKDRDELQRIEAAAELVTVGHRAVREFCEPGICEVELWDAARDQLDRATGGRFEGAIDLMTGERTALVGRPPGDARVEPGAPVLFDFAPRLRGYWADSCATFVCGVPTRAIARRHLAVRDALERGLRAARPGVKAAAVDAAIRSRLAEAGLECPHDVGHGVGTAPREAPWISRGNQSALEQGMVITLEPGAYVNGFGLRLEHLAVIEAEGARLLTQHSLSLSQEVL